MNGIKSDVFLHMNIPNTDLQKDHWYTSNQQYGKSRPESRRQSMTNVLPKVHSGRSARRSISTPRKSDAAVTAREVEQVEKAEEVETLKRISLPQMSQTRKKKFSFAETAEHRPDTARKIPKPPKSRQILEQ